MQKVVIIGAGGHGKVIADIVVQSGAELVGFLDDGQPLGAVIMGHPVLGPIAKAEEYVRQGCQFLIAIGNNKTRRAIAEKYDLPYYTAIHPRATIAAEVSIAAGSVVMAGAVVNPGAVVGRHCILNTSCVVEHDNRLGDFVHICPRVALAGTVTVGSGTQIGVGSSVINNVNIAADCLLGAGAVVVRDISEAGLYVGVPARLVRTF